MRRRARSPLRACLAASTGVLAVALLVASPTYAGSLLEVGGIGISTGKGKGVEVTVKPPVALPVQVPEVSLNAGGGSGIAEVSVGGQPVVTVAPPPPPPTVTVPVPVPESTTPSAPTGASGVAPAAPGAPSGKSASSGHLGTAHTSSASPTAAPQRTSQGRPGRKPARAGAAAPGVGPAALAADITKTSRGRAHAPSESPLSSLGRALPLPLPVPDWSKPIIAALLVLALFFAVRSRRGRRRARVLEARGAMLAHEIDVMQLALVPDVPAEIEGLAVSVAYHPAEGPAAGGDFYDVFSPAPGRVAVVLGDVAGHGEHALGHAALARYTLRAYLQAGLEPRAAIALAGAVLADPDGELLATVAVAVYDSERSMLVYALAGHPPPLIRGAGAARPISAFSAPPLGWSQPTGTRQRTLSLPAGSQVCFFTDGLIEARTGEQGEAGLLGLECLAGMFGLLGARARADELLGSVRSASESTPDDMAACVVRAQAAEPTERVDLEDVEVEPGTLDRPGLRELLVACEVPDCDIDAALCRAKELFGDDGTPALLRIDRAVSPAQISVVAIERPAGLNAPHPGGPTLLAA